MRRLIVLTYAWGLLSSVPTVVLPQTTNASLEQRIQEDVTAFLSARTSMARAEIATRVATAIVESAASESLESDLATWTGVLVGISDTNAPAVAAAMVRAVGPSHRDEVLAAVALVATSESDNGKAVRNSIIAIPGMERSTAKIVLEHPEQVLPEEKREEIMGMVHALSSIQANWDPVTSRPKRDIFADQDGGERPHERDRATGSAPKTSGGE